jgi:hypothetical protein
MAPVKRLTRNEDDISSGIDPNLSPTACDVAPTRRRAVYPSDIMQRCYRTHLRQSTVHIAYSRKFFRDKDSRTATTCSPFDRAGMAAVQRPKSAGRTHGIGGRAAHGRRGRLIDPCSLVQSWGAILGAGRAGSHRARTGRDRSTRASSALGHSTTERRSLHGSAASPPLGVEVSETLCPMIRMLVKNAEDPAGYTRLRPGRPDPPAPRPIGWHSWCRRPGGNARRSRASHSSNGR